MAFHNLCDFKVHANLFSVGEMLGATVGSARYRPDRSPSVVDNLRHALHRQVYCGSFRTSALSLSIHGREISRLAATTRNAEIANGYAKLAAGYDRLADGCAKLAVQVDGRAGTADAVQSEK